MRQILLFALCMFSSCLAFTEINEAVESEALIQPVPNLLSLSAAQADWTFSGVVSNENGEKYNYYFEIHHYNQLYSAKAALIDHVNKHVVLYEEASAQVNESKDKNSWHIGRIFLKFNPINNSWIFGVKKTNGKGFNFKVDMMELANNPTSKKQKLRSGVEFLVSQTGQLNGHLQTGIDNKEQFITAPKTWFRQIWVSQPQNVKHSLTGILCDFYDGNAFYAISLQETDAVRGAIAGWRDDKGEPVAMSQFVNIEEKDQGNWSIHIASPKLNLALQDMLYSMDTNHQLVAGLIDDTRPGFCTISQNELVQLEATVQAS